MDLPSLIQRLDRGAPGFADHLRAGDSLFDADSYHGVFAACSAFVRERAPAPEGWQALAELLNEVADDPGDLGIAACTCFLENLAHPGHPLEPFLRGQALAYWTTWRGGS